LDTVTFDNNYVIDANTLYMNGNRSNALLLFDFYGYLVLKNSYFKNNKGIADSTLVSSKLSSIN
jgi:hypothetical protein